VTNYRLLGFILLTCKVHEEEEETVMYGILALSGEFSDKR
jgi:hypothetical protein